ncbi:phage terminase small subunit P27 family [Trebonia kvetii]|uniref:phage terminase small subunit P27 family n=1 Tax=Trebonia kvetii TaxID=2480626 RepID=UPI0016529A58|nr:phage terminase small subunit P27 family [Trebonia kvetii]
MANQYARTPVEVMQRRSHNGKTLGGRDLEVIDVSNMAPVAVPPVPKGLAERGSAEWLKIWTAGKWLWPDQDYAWVEMACKAYDRIAVFEAQILEDGPMVPGYRPGMLVSHPLFTEIDRAETVIRKCLSQLGFSPTDRARLKLTELKGASELQKLVNGSQHSAQGNTVQSYIEGEW